jgi:hypothetical protein
MAYLTISTDSGFRIDGFNLSPVTRRELVRAISMYGKDSDVTKDVVKAFLKP